MKMRFEVAPAWRMAVTAACTDVAQVLMSRSCGSFMTPKAILLLFAYLAAIWLHKLAN